MRKIRGLVVLVMLALTAVPSARADSSFPQNRLVNSSFETGDSAPQGWWKFGLAECKWDFGGAEGDRCLSATGDGTYANGWYASTWAPVEPNRVYGVSFRVRQEAQGDAGEVFAGLNQVRRYSRAGTKWERQSYHFRTPDRRAKLRFEVGEDRLLGTAYFDDVALYPSLPIYRSRGLGRYRLGEGERIKDWEYTAEFHPDASHLNNCHFLLRFLAEFQQGRWVLAGSDAVYFAHEIEIFGMPTVSVLGMSAQAVGDLHGTYTASDPGELRYTVQEAARAEVDVSRCQGLLLVQAARSLDGPWRLLGEIHNPGGYKYTLPGSLFPARHICVRLTTAPGSHVEVSGYRYASRILDERKEEPVIGATYYVDVLQESPELQARVLEVGELLPKGRDEVKIEFTHTGPRRRLVVAVMVKKGDAVTYQQETSFRVGPDTKTVQSFPYEIKSTGAQSLLVVVRDADTSAVLLDLRSEFEVPEAPAPSAPAAEKHE